MVSIAAPGGHPPHQALHDAVDWGRVVVATVARGVVATLLGLALWSAAPAVIGWQPTTVMTGSMEPRLAPGDVVVTRPVAPSEVRPGRILLATDPDQRGHLRMHRYVDDGPGDTIITKGDANPQQDSTPVERSAVRGVAFLRIPFVGAPVRWLREGRWGSVAVLAVGLVALLALCGADGALRRTARSDPDGGPSHSDDDGDGDVAARVPAGREARVGVATGLPSGGTAVRSRRTARARERRVRRLRRGGAAVVVVAVAATGFLLPAQAVAAPFGTTTGNPTSTFVAGTATAVPTLSCSPASSTSSSTSVQISWTYQGSTVPVSFDLVSGSTVVATAGGTARSLTYSGGGLLALNTPYVLQLRTNLGGSWTTVSTATVNVKVSSVAGVLTSAACG